MTVAKYTNEVDGLEAVVSQTGAAKFTCEFRDTDADMVIEYSLAPTLELAINRAQRLVYGIPFLNDLTA